MTSMDMGARSARTGTTGGINSVFNQPGGQGQNSVNAPFVGGDNKLGVGGVTGGMGRPQPSMGGMAQGVQPPATLDPAVAPLRGGITGPKPAMGMGGFTPMASIWKEAQLPLPSAAPPTGTASSFPQPPMQAIYMQGEGPVTGQVPEGDEMVLVPSPEVPNLLSKSGSTAQGYCPINPLLPRSDLNTIKGSSLLDRLRKHTGAQEPVMEAQQPSRTQVVEHQTGTKTMNPQEDEPSPITNTGAVDETQQFTKKGTYPGCGTHKPRRKAKSPRKHIAKSAGAVRNTLTSADANNRSPRVRIVNSVMQGHGEDAWYDDPEISRRVRDGRKPAEKAEKTAVKRAFLEGTDSLVKQAVPGAIASSSSVTPAGHDFYNQGLMQGVGARPPNGAYEVTQAGRDWMNRPGGPQRPGFAGIVAPPPAPATPPAPVTPPAQPAAPTAYAPAAEGQDNYLFNNLLIRPPSWAEGFKSPSARRLATVGNAAMRLNPMTSIPTQLADWGYGAANRFFGLGRRTPAGPAPADLATNQPDFMPGLNPAMSQLMTLMNRPARSAADAAAAPQRPGFASWLGSMMGLGGPKTSMLKESAMKKRAQGKSRIKTAVTGQVGKAAVMPPPTKRPKRAPAPPTAPTPNNSTLIKMQSLLKQARQLHITAGTGLGGLIASLTKEGELPPFLRARQSGQPLMPGNMPTPPQGPRPGLIRGRQSGQALLPNQIPAPYKPFLAGPRVSKPQMTMSRGQQVPMPSPGPMQQPTVGGTGGLIDLLSVMSSGKPVPTPSATAPTGPITRNTATLPGSRSFQRPRDTTMQAGYEPGPASSPAAPAKPNLSFMQPRDQTVPRFGPTGAAPAAAPAAKPATPAAPAAPAAPAKPAAPMTPNMPGMMAGPAAKGPAIGIPGAGPPGAVSARTPPRPPAMPRELSFQDAFKPFQERTVPASRKNNFGMSLSGDGAGASQATPAPAPPSPGMTAGPARSNALGGPAGGNISTAQKPTSITAPRAPGTPGAPGVGGAPGMPGSTTAPTDRFSQQRAWNTNRLGEMEGELARAADPKQRAIIERRMANLQNTNRTTLAQAPTAPPGGTIGGIPTAQALQRQRTQIAQRKAMPGLPKLSSLIKQAVEKMSIGGLIRGMGRYVPAIGRMLSRIAPAADDAARAAGRIPQVTGTLLDQSGRVIPRIAGPAGTTVETLGSTANAAKQVAGQPGLWDKLHKAWSNPTWQRWGVQPAGRGLMGASYGSIADYAAHEAGMEDTNFATMGGLGGLTYGLGRAGIGPKGRNLLKQFKKAPIHGASGRTLGGLSNAWQGSRARNLAYWGGLPLTGLTSYTDEGKYGFNPASPRDWAERHAVNKGDELAKGFGFSSLAEMQKSPIGQGVKGWNTGGIGGAISGAWGALSPEEKTRLLAGLAGGAGVLGGGLLAMGGHPLAGAGVGALGAAGLGYGALSRSNTPQSLIQGMSPEDQQKLFGMLPESAWERMTRPQQIQALEAAKGQFDQGLASRNEYQGAQQAAA